MYTVVFSKNAIKSLKRIPKDYQSRIKNLKVKLHLNPFLLDLKKLNVRQYDATHRLRLGPYRIFLYIGIEEKLVGITNIERRTTQTYR